MTIRRHTVLAAALLGAAALLAGCSKDKAVEEPAELVEFRSTLRVERAWSNDVGKAKPRLRHGLGVAIDGGRVFAAGYGGDVYAWDLRTGRQAWRTRTRLPLTGGPGVGAGLVVAGASHGDLVALDAATGAVRWKSRVNSELLAAPAMAPGLVVLRTVDGRVIALNAADGKQAWETEQPVPRLSLRGTASPVIAGDIAVSGFDNGRVLGISLRDGGTAWDTVVAPPSGRTELERLNDIDAAVVVADGDVYAVTFQGRLARLALDSGQVWWARDLSSNRGVALDADAVYVATADGQVVKTGRQTGVEIWRQEALSRRRLSGPAVIGRHVAVADLEGYVHFLDADSGTTAARVRAGKGRVLSPLVVSGDMLVLMNDEGRVTAFRVPPPRGAQ